MKRVAIVTGGANGMGREVVLELIAEGYAACALDIVDDKIAEISAELANEDFIAIKCNVLEEASVNGAFAQAVKHFGKLDVLVNIVGGSMAVSQPIDEIPLESWEKVIALNLRSTFLCSKAAVALMRPNRYGRIVNMSSMAGRSRSVFGGAPYSAAKAGVIGFTRQCSKDLAPFGITMNAVAPGTIMSGDRIASYWDNKTPEDKRRFFDANPSGRLGEPKDVAKAIVFLCHEDSSYINGAVIDVNGGMWVG